MSLTWKEGVTTIAAAAAVVLERAYYHNYTWSLVSSTRWVVFGLGLATAIGYIFSYVLDADRKNTIWTTTANLLGAAVLVVTILGLIYATSGYVVTLMVGAIVFWAAAMVRHLYEPAGMTHHPAV